MADREKRIIHNLTNLVLKPEHIRNIAEDTLSDTILRVETSLRRLAQGQDDLRQELNAFKHEPCKIELQSLNDELAVVRDRVDGEFRKL